MYLLKDIWFWIIILLLAIDIFLVMLNGYLRGRWKHNIDAFGGGFWALLLIIVLIFYGWKILIITIIGSFIFGGIIMDPAARVATRLLKH